MRWGRSLVALALLAVTYVAAEVVVSPPDGPALVPFEVPSGERPTAGRGTLVIRLSEAAGDGIRDEAGSLSVLVFDEDGRSPVEGEPVRYPGFARRLAPGRYTVAIGRGAASPTYAAECSAEVEVGAGAVTEVVLLALPDPGLPEPPPCLRLPGGQY